ncbi:MAG: hypothetical protein Q9M11_02545 [Mariprofundaceae bacterium]|nr:hypothetical protein [Mariprofundaceae bacterium]
MFQALKNFITGSENKIVAKSDLHDVVSATFTAISKNVIPTLKAVSGSKEYFKTDKVYILANMGGSLGLRNSSPEEVIKDLTNFFKEVLAEEKSLTALIDKDISDKVFPALATAQELAIMKTISDVSSVTLYMLDMVYYIMADEDTEYPKRKIEELQVSMPYFTTIVRAYINRFDKHVEDLHKVARTPIDTRAAGSLMDKLLSKQGKVVGMPVVNGFINNPIYHIRMWFVDRDIDKYESLKEKKKLIELKLLDIKMRANGKHDERLAKQVAYYEDKVSGIEYDLKDLSGSE